MEDGILLGNWTVSSAGAEIGGWNPSGETAGINGFTLGTDGTVVPEPNTMLAAALLILPLSAGALHKLRKNRTENLTA